MPYEVTLERANGKRTGDETVTKQIDYLVRRALAGSRGTGWQMTGSNKATAPLQRPNGLWLFRYRLLFEKVSGRKDGDVEYKQWEAIQAMLSTAGAGTKFGPYPWRIMTNGHATQTGIEPTAPDPSEDSPPIEGEIPDVQTRIIPGVRDVAQSNRIVTWADMMIPPELLNGESNNALSKHDAFKNLYDLGPQIRTILSTIEAARRTNGAERHHAVCWGHAGCGKTETLLAIERLFGEGSVLRLDGTSTTRAGLEKMFFQDLRHIPPLVYLEEAEKANEDFLKIWLGALDDRGEIRKVNFRMQQVRPVKILFICTVNDKNAFDNMMGSDGSEPGALSSRCATDVYFPQPNDQTLLKILLREIRDKNGRVEWAEPALKLARELDMSNPRKVQSLLAGGDRLLDGSYQADRLKLFEAAKLFNGR